MIRQHLGCSGPFMLRAFDFLGGGSSSTSSDSRTGASDDAKATGGAGSPLTTDDAKAVVGKNSKIVEAGSIDFGSSKDAKLLGANAADFSGIKGNVDYTVNSVDAEIVKAALDQVSAGNTLNASTITNLIDKANETQAASAAQSNQILDTFATKLATATETEQTDGLSPILKTGLWFGALAVLGLLVWRWNK